IAVSRCEITDSLYLYLIGPYSYRLNLHNHTFDFTTVFLKSQGLKTQNTTYIKHFSINDYWVGGYYYALYHWNGFDYKKIEPFPYFSDNSRIGRIVKVTKGGSGKIWILIETTSQTFQIVQGEI
ncbi:MAG: hypothetical protein K8H86_03310, partial [Ignavibacteriaceae bacterium]|nr:hypothetical protein [Ignavibacteriaceae bacterium]